MFTYSNPLFDKLQKSATSPTLNSEYILQWNPVNTVTNGPKKIGCINDSLYYKKMHGRLARQQKSGCNNEVTILPRWP